MNPHLKALFERCSGKGWYLVAIIDNTFEDSEDLIRARQCEKCGVHIRWVFKCAHPAAPNEFIKVGKECVKSVVDKLNGPESITFMRSQWRQRRKYFYKRFHDYAVIVGPRQDGFWWTAVGYSVTNSGTWAFCHSFPSVEQAKTYISMRMLTGAIPKLKPQEPWLNDDL